MWVARENGEPRREGGNGLIAVAVDGDKASQYALKWSVDHILSRGDSVLLLHVKQTPPPITNSTEKNYQTIYRQQPDSQTMETFLPFRCFCMRRQVQCEVMMVENTSIAKALIDCVSRYAIRALFMGAPRSSFTRLFKAADVPSCVLKGAPDFCNIYIISRGKLSSMRAASRPLPTTLPAVERPLHNLNDGVENDMSPLDRPRASDNSGLYEELDLNASFAGSGRPSTSSSILSFYESLGSEMVHRRAKSSDFDNRSFERTLSMINMEDMEDKIRRLELELKHTMDNYHAACEEAFIAKQKARELQYWKMGEEQRLEAAIAAERAALLIAEKEREKSKAAVEAAEAAERAVELEAHKRADAEKKALREAEEKKKVLDALGHASILFRYQSLFHFLFLLALFFFVYGLEKKLS